MGIKLRLILMNILQYFIWGSWLTTIGAYWFQNRQWSSTDFGATFSTMGIASVFMPAIAGIIVDRFVPAQKMYGFMHLVSACTLFLLPQLGNPDLFFWVLLVSMIFYMPTIALSITVAYNALKKENLDVVKVYPPIRTWGTIGFIAALLTVSLTGNEVSANQFYIASGTSVLLGIYAFTLPDCPPQGKHTRGKRFTEILGLNAFKLFKDKNIAVFFIFSMLLGAALQLTNAYADPYLHDFGAVDAYKNSFPVRHPGVILAISQASETLFILAIPFFLKRMGIKYVMLISMIAWVLRFALLGLGNPEDGLWMIILSCIIYGMAFDFFNISGSLYVETQTAPGIRGSAQGLFMMMVNGFGALIGSYTSGVIIDHFFINADGSKHWFGIWMTFAAYALVLAIAFPFMFRQKNKGPASEAALLKVGH